MSLYLHTDGKLLHVSGGLAHAQDCCCSVCTEADGPCCLSGVAVTVGGCECEELGGEIITDTNPCECDQTSISCCYEGNSINLSRCDCKTVGGKETGTCSPEGPADGCDICITTSLTTHSIPLYWSCLSYGGSCGDSPSPCASRAGQSGGPGLCFTTCSTDGTCFNCGGGSGALCYKTGGHGEYNSMQKSYSYGFCASSSVTSYIDFYAYGAPCATTQTNYPIIGTTIHSPITGCGVMHFTETARTSSSVVGSGCAGVDISTVNSSSSIKSITCPPC